MPCPGPELPCSTPTTRSSRAWRATAAAAWAAGAHMHDIRQGLRTFSTSFFQAPGRLNQVPIDGYRVILDYCHNVDGMRRLAEFVGLMMDGRNGSGREGRAIGVIGI